MKQDWNHINDEDKDIEQDVCPKCGGTDDYRAINSLGNCVECEKEKYHNQYAERG